MQSRIDDLRERAERVFKTCHSNFYKSESFANLKLYDNYVLSGGLGGAERVVYFALPRVMDEEDFDVLDYISCLKISVNDKNTYSHRDYLGAIMALQVDREKFGDIIVSGGSAYVLGFKVIIEFLKDNLKEISRTGCRCEDCELSDIPIGESDKKSVTVSVQTMRLDAILCRVFMLNRERAKTLVENGFVTIAGKPCQKSEKLLSEGQIVAVKGYGRFSVAAENGVSRKGKQRITVEVFA